MNRPVNSHRVGRDPAAQPPVAHVDDIVRPDMLDHLNTPEAIVSATASSNSVEDDGALACQHRVDSRGAVDALGVGMDLTDARRQLLVAGLPDAGAPIMLAPVLERRGTDADLPEHGLDPESVLVFGNER
jgi:hypothetical protein